MANPSISNAPRRRTPTLIVDAVGLTITVLLVAAFCILKMGGNYRKSQALDAEMATITEGVDSLPQLRHAVLETEKMLADHATWVEEAELQLPGCLDFEGFYSALSRNAAKHGVLLQTVRPGDAEEDVRTGFFQMEVAFRALAGFEDFHGFLYELLRLPGRMIEIESLSITPSSDPRLCDVNLAVVLRGQCETEPAPAAEGEDAP